VEVSQGSSSDMLATSKIPLITTTKDAVVADNGDELDMPETDDEELSVPEDTVYEDLEDLKSEMSGWLYRLPCTTHRCKVLVGLRPRRRSLCSHPVLEGSQELMPRLSYPYTEFT